MDELRDIVIQNAEKVVEYHKTSLPEEFKDCKLDMIDDFKERNHIRLYFQKKTLESVPGHINQSKISFVHFSVMIKDDVYNLLSKTSDPREFELKKTNSEAKGAYNLELSYLGALALQEI